MEFRIEKDVKYIPHKRHWQFCVGSGHAKLALRTDYTKQLKFIHEELGIRRVRFHGIFDDDMNTIADLTLRFPLPGAESFTEQNFHSCGVAYDNVLEAGMKPFVELGFMPEKLAGGDTRGVFYYAPNITPPGDYGKWAGYVRDFILFLQHRYGEEEIRTWFFEVWNEPDLRVPFFAGSRDEYFRLYEVTARAIKEVDSQLLVGGPATSGSKWVKSFVEYCHKNEAPVDFITTHQYAGDPLGGIEDQGEEDFPGTANQEEEAKDVQDKEKDGRDGQEEAAPDREGKIEEFVSHIRKQLEETEEKTFLAGFRAVMPDKSELMEIPRDLLARNSVKVKQQAQGLPIYYTEWNANAIFSAYTNDTRKVAAYQVKTILDTMDIIDGSSIWCFSDIFEELHPFGEEFHGGFGLLTLDGIPKPAFYGLKMLTMAGDERMDLGEDATEGEIGIAGFRRAEELQILLFRQKMRNLELPKEHTKVEIHSDRIPERVLAYRIDEEHCNPLKLWERDGRPIDLNRSEIERLKEESSMKAEEWEYQYAEGVITVEAELGVNDLYFFRIC